MCDTSLRSKMISEDKAKLNIVTSPHSIKSSLQKVKEDSEKKNKINIRAIGKDHAPKKMAASKIGPKSFNVSGICVMFR